MAKNNKYLQYAKSRNKTQLNIDLQQIAVEFGRLLNKRFCYVFSGGIKVEFQFKMENSYHLLGFHKLTDVTIIKMVENHKLKKEDFYKIVRDGKVSMDMTDSDIVGDFEETIVHIQDTEHKSDFDNSECNTVIDADKVFF